MDAQTDPVGAALARALDEAGAPAAAHGGLYRRLWDELDRAASGGKRFRGRLVVETCAALGGARPAQAAQVGAAFELLHAGFLMHDDLIDHDTIRRGEPNLAGRMAQLAQEGGAQAGDARELAHGAALLAGDLALALAHRLISRTGGSEAVALSDLLWQTVFVSVAGELGDISAAAGLQAASLEQSLQIAAEKTAFYSFQAPLRAGGLLAGASPEALGCLDAAGLGLGKAFQLADDLLGVFAPEAVTGKSALSDLREGKVTTLILQARRLPVWSRIEPDLGRADLEEQTAARMRADLAGSPAPRLVRDQALAELESVAGLIGPGGALGAAGHVIEAAAAMVAERVQTAATYAGAGDGSCDTGL